MSRLGAPENKDASSAVVQWDPERVLVASGDSQEIVDANKPAGADIKRVKWCTAPVGDGSVRSIQIGLRGGPKNLLADRTFVKRVTDVTDRFVAAGRSLEAGDRAAAETSLWPSAEESERILDVPACVRDVLGMGVILKADV